ncbi:hypothetical protein BKA64DRAFT_129400 [Cadophora sp. MPI-SDFR-AT-0126]|nr:hypothetical protein BKA64DRAFT_129400 [Leotiomycetes sp. MPI-SDFR-AT-0126]
MHAHILPEIAAWFGSDASVGGIKFQFSTTIKKNLDALRDGRARGLDCKDITLPSLANYGQGGQGPSSISFYSTAHFYLHNFATFLMSLIEMAAIMGSDVTPNGLRFQFTDRIRPIGKKLQEMKSAGLDPKDIDLESLYSAKGGGKTGRSQTRSLLISFSSIAQTSRTYTPVKSCSGHLIDLNTQTSASTSARIAPRVALNFNSEPSSKTPSVKRFAPMLVAIPKP